MAYTTVDGLRMYYEEHGRSDGPPLVLLHGFTMIGDFWAKQLVAFGARYRLIVPDLRGHGRTDNPGGRAAMNHRQFAADIVGLCQNLALERTAFCGESAGAMLQLSLALLAPRLAAACILAGGTHYVPDSVRALQDQLTPANMDPEWARRVRAEHTQTAEHARTVMEAFHDLGAHQHADDYPEADELTSIDVPVLIVQGDRDGFFPVEVPLSLYRLLPNAELCVLPNTNHEPPNERPEWFNAIAVDFLDRRYRDQPDPPR
ncbi:MAG: alpha/beta fold hydrolase [Chloroflexota bacterium]